MASLEQAFKDEFRNNDGAAGPVQSAVGDDEPSASTPPSSLPTESSGDNNTPNSGQSGSGDQTAGGSRDVVEIDSSNIPKNHVFSINPTTMETTFVYDVIGGASIDAVAWRARRDMEAEFEDVVAFLFKDKNPSLSQPFKSVNDTAAVLNLGAISSNQLFNRWREQQMILQVNWTRDDSSGFTKSGLFSVVDNERRVSAVSDGLEIATQAEADEPPETTVSVSPDAALPSSSSSAPGGAAGPSSSGVSSGKGGGGGLGTGAIAGIAVGAVIGGLLLIGALAWFLIRRRRQNRELKSGYNGQQSSGTYMVDKETHGRVTETPTSPYSDDNQGQPVPLDDIDVAREGSTTRNEQPGFAPYQDAPRRPSVGSQGDRASGTQTPQGVSTNVAHLVEEGMTAEEIRRLEEEERQLDDEIERAARR